MGEIQTFSLRRKAFLMMNISFRRASLCSAIPDAAILTIGLVERSEDESKVGRMWIVLGYDHYITYKHYNNVGDVEK